MLSLCPPLPPKKNRTKQRNRALLSSVPVPVCVRDGVSAGGKKEKEKKKKPSKTHICTFVNQSRSSESSAAD